MTEFDQGTATRISAAKLVTGLALLVGMMLSWNLWIPVVRHIPRAPLIDLLRPGIVPGVEFLLSGLLLIAIGAFLLTRRSTACATAIAVLLILLVLMDQTRLQPWVYQYGLIFIVFALLDQSRKEARSAELTISALQAIVALLYFWSGVQKLNFTFIHETLPALVSPLQSFLGFHLPLTSIALAVVASEIFAGAGLLFRRTRKISVVIAVAMHCAVLALLISRGFNHIVWAWNVALIALDLLLFWKCEVYLWQSFSAWRHIGRRARLVQILVLAYAILPALSFAGWWDMYLSGALYSGNTEIAVIDVDPQLIEKLPPAAQHQVFTTSLGETVLPLQEWSLAEFNVPPYPQMRVFRQIANQVCAMADNKDRIGLTVKDRPRIWDGTYEVIRIPCGK